jgi:predicted O-linked N-acetylglucosamine transferase (SPINDLY family)
MTDPLEYSAGLRQKASDGRRYVTLGQFDRAIAIFSQILAIDPQNPDAHNGRGVALRALRRFEPALESFAAALRHHPGYAAAANNYGLTLHDLGRSQEAAAQLRRTVEEHPRHVSSLHNLGMILHSIDRHEEAAQFYARLVDIAPDHPYAAGNLARSRLACCEWSHFEADKARVSHSSAADHLAADAMTALMVLDSAAAQRSCARRFAAREYPTSASPLWRSERYPHDRIRVAYLSADFHDHPVAHLLAGVLEAHDRTRFETIGVSLRRDARAGAASPRLQRAFEHFHDVTDLTDREAAVLLRQLEVDIVVDLSGPTRGGRLGILASRPAPLQINYLGFAGTYGTPYVDYIIADRVVIPRGREAQFAERIIRLPLTFLPNDDRQPVAANVARRCDVPLPESGFVFCAFSNAYKINPPMFDVWMRLLREIPGSVLWLRGWSQAMAANLSREASARGIDPERLQFAPREPEMSRHLARYQLADLFLDTTPYGAHATARDALWAGLPVLTCAGDTFASRVAASLLHALELPELVTDGLDAYFAAALDLARSPGRLRELRLRLARRDLPGFQTDPYREQLERAYRAIWERYMRGEIPADIGFPA